MAAKEFKRDQKVGDRLGMNEKTKVICKLCSPGGGPPAREPAVSEDERKAMMAFYFKKQVRLTYIITTYNEWLNCILLFTFYLLFSVISWISRRK